MHALCRFLIILFLVFPCFHLFAQVPDPGPLLDSLDTAPLEYYLDKADRQNMQTQWMQYAGYGLGAALSAWETEALILLGEDVDLSDYRAEAEGVLNEILEARFAEWLNAQFFSGLTPPSLTGLSMEIAELNETYLYDRDQNGELIRDEEGNAVYKTSIDFAEEKELWSEGGRDAIDALLAGWREEMVTAGDRLLASVSDPQVKEYVRRAYGQKFETWESNYRKELYRLYYREQSRFFQLRLYDQRSLERITEQQTAEYISGQLIARTQAELEAGLDTLVAGLEAQVEIQTDGHGAVDADGWMESFRSLLESGIDAWDNAEEELLMERIQWEQTCGEEILEAEESWAEAFRVLQEKRSEWMDSYRVALEEGNRLWARESEALEGIIAAAVAELEEACENEKASLQSRVSNLIGMLLQSVNMMRTARTSWEYWMDQFDGGEMGSFDASDIDFDTRDMRRACVAAALSRMGYGESEDVILHTLDWLEDNSDGGDLDLWAENLSSEDIRGIFDTYEPFSVLDASGKSTALETLTETLNGFFADIRMALDGTFGSASLEESFYWLEKIFAVYQRYAREAQDSLGGTYGIIVFDDESLRTAFDEDGNLSGLLSGAILHDDDLWEQLYLDPYQVEILKARAYLQYWEKQGTVAQAVYDYALDHSSSKEEASVTEAKLEEAKRLYDDALGEYRALIGDLEELGIGLEERQRDMEMVQQQITKAQEDLSDAREELSLLFGDLSVNNPRFLAEQYRAYYLELLAAYGMDGRGEGVALGSAFEEYLLAAKSYGLEKDISLVSEEVLVLLSGEEDTDLGSAYFNPDTASLQILHDRAVDAAGAGFITEAAEGEGSNFFVLGEQAEYEFISYLKDMLHLSMDDYRYDMLLDLYDRFYSEAETLPGEVLWQMQRMVYDIRTSLRLEYEVRLARIRLLTCDDLEEWADQYLPDVDTEGAGTTKELYELLVSDGTTSPYETLITSLEQDMAVYEDILQYYDTYTAHGGQGDFTLYAWDVDDLCGGSETLTVRQGMQFLWNYQLECAGGDEGRAAGEIALIIGALETLRDYLLDLGDLDGHTGELENALLYGGYLDAFLDGEGVPEDRRGAYNFLKAYLNGSGALVTDEENVSDYFRLEESQKEAMRSALITMLEDARNLAPVLASIAREEARGSLISWLDDHRLLMDDGKTFRRPETVWNVSGFTSWEDVVRWFINLDYGLEILGEDLPAYVYDEFEGFIGELKDYAALKAAQAWPDDIPAELDGLNEEIRILCEESENISVLLSELMMDDSAGGVIAFFKILSCLDVLDPLYEKTGERFVLTCGYDLAYRASLETGFSGTGDRWDALLKEYFYDTDLADRPGIDAWGTAIVEAAKENYDLAAAAASPEETDWATVPDEWRDAYMAGLWNSLDFEEALASLSGDNAVIDVHVLEFLRLVDENLDTAAAGGMPEDTVLAWVYRGDEARREIDELIVAGGLNKLAAVTHDFTADCIERYYPRGLTAEELTLDPADPAEVQGAYGLLRLYARLSLIHTALVIGGGYDEDFGFGDMIDLITADLFLDTGDRSLLLGIENGAAEALEAWLDEREGTTDPAGLTGEDLYWNRLWKIRIAMTEGDYRKEEFRNSWIFDGNGDPAIALRGWLEVNGEKDLLGLRTEYLSMLDSQGTDLVNLARKPGGRVYADILSLGLEAALVESKGYESADAAVLTAWFLSETGVTADDGRSIEEYLSRDVDSRILLLLNGDPTALEHYIKRGIFLQRLEPPEVDDLLEGIGDQGFKASIYDFLARYEAVRGYNELLHGNIAAYLKDKFEGDEDTQFGVEAIYERFMGSDRSRWDDPVFMIDIGLGDRCISDILESLACNKTRGYSDILYGADGSVLSTAGQSVNGVFLNTVRRSLIRRLAGDDGCLMDRLSLAYARKEVVRRAGDWVESGRTGARDHWRSFLSEEYLASEDDETDLIPDKTVDGMYEDYDRDLSLGDEGDEAALEGYTGLKVFYQTGSEEDNYLLDAANSYLDRAAFFVGALELWDTTEEAEGSIGSDNMRTLIDHLNIDPEGSFTLYGEEYETVWAYLEGLDYSEFRDAFSYDMDAGITEDYDTAGEGYRDILGRIEALKKSLGLFGRRREVVQRLAEAGEDEISEALRPLRQEIGDLEEEIAELQLQWQALTDREADGDGRNAGYRQLEETYARVYALAREAFDRLDGAKQEYLLARAVYDYASAAYIGTGEDEGSEEDRDDDMQEILLRVTPAERLDYVTERLTRARAAYDALVHLVNESVETTYTIYEKDPVYRSLFDAYLTAFRESLALNKINEVLNQAVARQETVTRKALEDWNTARRESYCPHSIRDAGGNVDISDLTGLGLIQSADGIWRVSWGSGDVTDEEAIAYFEAADDSETGMSAFENDLSRWLSAVYALQRNKSSTLKELMARWGMALLWEEYQATPEEDREAALYTYLDRVQERDLDREGAKALLLSRWEKAYDTRGFGIDNGQWMYDFYKLLEKSGCMGVASEDRNDRVTFTDFAEIESVILANEYMAEGKEAEGRRLILSSIPIFTMAAAYFAMAVAAVSILPFGWIAAIPLLAAFTLLMIQGANLAGEGNMLRAAARKVQAIVSDNEDRRDVMFADFKTVTADIIQKQNLYEKELAMLNAMKGDAGDSEELSNEEMILRLRNSVIQAFEEENEDLGSLLKKARLLADEGDEHNPDVLSDALDALFGTYLDRMSESARAGVTGSQAFISALEKESIDARDEASRELNDELTGEDGLAREQNEAAETYRQAYTRYITGEITYEGFLEAAEAAFADPVFSTREHLLRLYERQERIARDILGDDQFGSDISSELLGDQCVLLTGTGDRQGIIDYRQEAYCQVRMYELYMLRLETAERRKQWEDRMSAILAGGQLEWAAGARDIRMAYKTWVEGLNREYTRQKDSWNDKYLDFLDDKQVWMDAVSIQSTKYGDEEVLSNFGEMTRVAIDAAGKAILIGSFDASATDPDDLLSEVVDFEFLDSLLRNAGNINTGIGAIQNAVFMSGRPDRFTTSKTLQAIKDFQTVKNEEYEQHLAALEFRELLEWADDAEENFYRQIEKANTGVKQGLHDVMLDEGYVLEGDLYTKDLVVGATISDYIEETGTIRRYRYYAPEAVDFSSELEAQEGNVGKMSSRSLEALLDKAVTTIEKKIEEIFGDAEDPETFLLPDSLVENDGTYNDNNGEGIDTGDYDYIQVLSVFEETIEQVYEDTGSGRGRRVEKAVPLYAPVVRETKKYRGVNISPGLFGKHIGYAPGFSHDADITLEWNAAGQIEFEGLGEMGEIMGQFIFNKIREGYGWAEVNSPHYMKRLWDDTDSWIEAPSIRDITELSTTALSVVTGGISGIANAALSGYCIGLVDDAVFTASGVDEGLMTWDEGLVSFGKTLAASAVTSFIPGMNNTGVSIFDEALNTVTHQFMTNAATGAIRSVTYSSDGKFGFDGTAFADTLVGEAALAGYAGSFFSTYTHGTIAGSMDDITGGFYGSAVDLGSEIAGKAAEYAVYAGFQFAEEGFDETGASLATAFTNMGGVSLNIVNLGALLDTVRLISVDETDHYNDQFLKGLGSAADSLTGTGLFSLNFTGGGVRGRISTEGINLGGSLYNLGKGFIADTAIKKYNEDNVGGDLLKYGYAYGDQAFEDTIWRVLSGKDSLFYNAGKGEAETVKTAEGGRAIRLSSAYSNIADTDALLKAVTVLQHEAHRDGTITGSNTEETIRAVLSHSSIAMSLAGAYGPDFILSDENLLMDILTLLSAINGGSSFEAYTAAAYESGGDFWRLTLDNNLVWDNSRNLNVEYVDPETGEVGIEEDARIDKTGSFSQSLMNYLGKDKAKELLGSRGINIEDLSDAEIAYCLMTAYGAEWNRHRWAYEPITLPGGQGYNMTALTDRLVFDMDPEKAFHLRKISQEDPSIACWAGEGMDRINVMAGSGCYYIATLGAVQTQAGVHLTADQINRITEVSLDNGWLTIEGDSIATQGNYARTEISRLAFRMLGIPASLDFVSPNKIDGFINVGKTVKGNDHASEWDFSGLLFDPYEGVEYLLLRYGLSEYERINEYQEYYWRAYEEMFR